MAYSLCPTNLANLLAHSTVREAANELRVGYNTVIRHAKKHGIVIDRRSPVLKTMPSQLTADQQDVVLGTLLGDGMITKSPDRPNCCYRFGQCSAKLEYVEYIQSLMQPFSQEIKTDANKKYFYTRFTPIFKSLRTLWYPDGIKIVPKQIRLTGRSLYFWFLDDGHNDVGDRSISLCTHGFKPEESDYLRYRLVEDLDIYSTLAKQHNYTYDKDYWFIRVRSKSFTDFLDLILRFGPVLKCNEYKMVSFAPRHTYHPLVSRDVEQNVLAMYTAGIAVKIIADKLLLSLPTVERLIYSDRKYRIQRSENKNHIKELAFDLLDRGFTQKYVSDTIGCSQPLISLWRKAALEHQPHCKR